MKSGTGNFYPIQKITNRHKILSAFGADDIHKNKMTIKPIPYYFTSFSVAVFSCIAFVLSAFQLYSDEDYVHNYLGCDPNGDTGAIPIMGSIMVSVFWGMVHVIAHIFFVMVTRSRAGSKRFNIRLGFYSEEKVGAYIAKSIFYLFAGFLVNDYVSTYYKFYLFEFVSFCAITITVLIYSMTVSNLIGIKKDQETMTGNAL